MSLVAMILDAKIRNQNDYVHDLDGEARPCVK